jgi:hypothetical protein
MAAPAKFAPPSRGTPGKGPPPAAGRGRPVPGARGKPGAEPPAAPAPPAEDPRLKRLRLVLFGLLGTALLGTLGAASWILYFREPDPIYVDIPPPEPAPPRPTGPVVRQGDLSDELWRRMGVRPQGE